MSTRSKNLFRAISLLILLSLLVPASSAGALIAEAPPPADMFQLPWDQGIAWVAIDGIDNGSKRPSSSSHNYKLGGAIDFAPKSNMVTGENTSNFWVAAAAAGTVVETSSCYVTIAHANGWITQYQFLGNIQVKLGDSVQRNQRLGVIADGVRLKYCPGFQDINVPHLHFMLRPSILGATFAGWEVKYNSLFNITTFMKGLTIVGLFKPLLNVMDTSSTATPTPVASVTPGPTFVASPTPTLFGPFVSATVNPSTINVGESTLVTISLNNVPTEGYTSAEFTCGFNPGAYKVSNITVANLFGADAAVAINGPNSNNFILAIAGSNGNKATTSGVVFTFNLKGLQPDQMYVGCEARVSTGNNQLTQIPSARALLVVVGTTPTVNLTPSSTPTVTAPPVQITPSATFTPVGSPTPTIPSDWIAYTNMKYGFRFLYPLLAQLVPGSTDNYARINLPFVKGTNLADKYLEVIVAENADPCQSPLATESILETSETVTMNGLSFLKQTGGDPSAGSSNTWVAYSTLRNNVCVSLDFVLRAVNPGAFLTPIPLFDEAAESLVFGQIVSTYIWMDLGATATPTWTVTASPSASPAPLSTSTPGPSPTATPGVNGTLTGDVTASKPVILDLFDANNNPVTVAFANPDGTFSLTAAPGTYTVVARADGYLRALGSVTLSAGMTATKPAISLLAGDIDGNSVIDQFDALTIGMSYNLPDPSAADLNNDGIINVLDLELLARNYRATGPVTW